MQLFHFLAFLLYGGFTASAPVFDSQTSTTRYNVGASIALLRLGDPGSCKFEYDCPDSSKPSCIHCPGASVNDAGWCSSLNSSPENNLCADMYFSEYCGTRHCLNGATVEIQTENEPVAFEQLTLHPVDETENMIEEEPIVFTLGDEQHALQPDPDRYLSEASIPPMDNDFREIDFD